MRSAVLGRGANARGGHREGLLVRTIRTDDGTEHAAADWFRTMGGYLTDRP